MTQERCPECGAPVSGGFDGCQEAWEQVGALAYSHPECSAARDLALDTYCMQHPARYCRSAKSYAAHLTRLCCGLVYDGSPGVYAAIQQWLDGVVAIRKPDVPNNRGSMTIVDICAAGNPVEYVGLVRAWAENVWEAYADQHDLAYWWIMLAQKQANPRQRK
ncbi:MAG: hypothetical protein JXB30_16465 [Anaerolineae bacterium]|nr:hypothetical protein [Anaerolineae bacterium]